MGQASRDLIPPAIRIAVRNAVVDPLTLRTIDDLFHSHEFTEQDASVPDAGGQRRTAVEGYHARIDWISPDDAQRYLDLVAELLDYYPEAEDRPGSPGRILRRALRQGHFVSPDGRLRLPGNTPTAQAAEPDVEGIWRRNRLRIFFSHVNDVRASASAIADGLESLQCSCFVAHVQIEPARDWQEVIENALRTCHVLVAYVTPGFKESNWTDQEVGWALGRGIPVIPVNAGLQPYGFFGSIQSLSVAPDATWGVAHSIFRAIAVSSFRGQSPTGAAIAPLVAMTIVQAFCSSGSYDSTRRRYGYLTMIPVTHWTEEMCDDLEAAAEFNDQVSEAGLNEPRMPAPEAISQLIRRVRRGLPP